MSMLAEPRRKQKWSVDPRNSAWSKDESKFGQKMLERMGWSKGKGLGRSEQGSTDHIKVKVKNNNYGLGTSASYEDNWIAHQDDFNELLAQLNNHHGQNNSTAPEAPPEEPKGFSLEEKSKTSRKRVHYMKFTKGKDLSSRTETDLNCIFGKRARSAKEQEQESSSSDSQGEAEESFTPASSKLDTESITKTVTSTLNMQEYFAQRMAQLKKARGQAQSTAPSVEAETNETSGPSEEPSPVHTSNDDSEELKKKKKKKKKSKKSADELEVAEENSAAPIVIEDDDADDQQQEHLGKKKKKRKTVENERATNENCSSTSGVEQNCEELPPSKKKKKLKKHNKETELPNGHGPTEDQTVESEVVLKKKKKKKQRQEVDDVVKEDQEELVEKKSKKDKKKKKKHQE
ncbi:PIN2/TERF1-interacting telomerase inhibitor 1 isoform X2 [Morone saxatilis]|uniref:PIN2/TERF1-interacting telomerase inhibitor 1 isoform X2 n=1 Tax=Morone saxatilis TaxID=34816 RepID=UPI0015E1FC08|nr:PIN2/TERF1-interacting telomerase inhibitor 1 isoform X2 [Morone saxatilis]